MKAYWVALRIIQEILRDRRTLAFFFLVPIFVMTLIYYAVAEDEVVKIGVVSRGIARLFDSDFINELDDDEDVELVSIDIADEETDPVIINKLIIDNLLKGKADGVLYMDKMLLLDRFSGKKGMLHIYVEGSRPLTTANVFSAIADAMDDLAARLPVVIDASCSALCANSVNNKAMELEKHYIYGSDDYRQIDYFLPALQMFFVFFFTFIISAVTFQRERLRGTLERLQVAPISFGEIIAGYIGGFFVFVGLQSAIILTYILLLIEFEFTSAQVLSLCVVTALTMLIALMLGLLASFLAANEFQALQFIPLVILPQIFLSDIIWDVDSFPKFFRLISYVFPLTHATAVARDVMIRNQPLLHSWPQLLILCGFIVLIFAVITSVANRKEKRY